MNKKCKEQWDRYLELKRLIVDLLRRKKTGTELNILIKEFLKIGNDYHFPPAPDYEENRKLLEITIVYKNYALEFWLGNLFVNCYCAGKENYKAGYSEVRAIRTKLLEPYNLIRNGK